MTELAELAEIFRRHGTQYRDKYGERIPFTHRQAMQAIEQCRTEVLGGHVYSCQDCDETLYSYHSCKNRHCPKCQNGTAEQWLERQRELLLSTPCFMVTFTLPASLRRIVRSHQKLLYNLLFRASAAALQQLANDPRFVGGQIGLVGVLHTWKRDLNYHPQVHYLVPRRRLIPRWPDLAPFQERFPGAGQTALDLVSSQVSGCSEKDGLFYPGT